MRIGVPKEVKVHEYRVAITPAGVHELTEHGGQPFTVALVDERDADALLRDVQHARLLHQ